MNVALVELYGPLGPELMVVTGGVNSTGASADSDTYVYDLFTRLWTRLTAIFPKAASGCTTNRWDASAAFASGFSTKVVVVHGGHCNNLGATTTTLDDYMKFDPSPLATGVI